LPFSVTLPGALCAPHSFPTRRSSDLYGSTVASMRRADSSLRRPPGSRRTPARSSASVMDVIAALSTSTDRRGRAGRKHTHYPLRSEEHTSELQSRFDLVCRLLLEKKN